MFTSLFFLALTAHPALVSTAPQWLDDYNVAYQRGQKERKPLAVFVANGPEGWDRLSREGRLTREIEQILRSDYVCVYLDVEKKANRSLASSFDLTSDRGVIISDQSGSKQAFRAEGKLSNEDLTRSLKKFADPDLVVTRTETPTGRPVFVPPPPSPPQFIRVQGGC